MFLGDNEYGTFQQPKSLLAAELSSSLALRGDNVGALLLPLGRLAPGQSTRFVTLLTQQEGSPTESLAAARALFDKYRDHQAVSAALAAMRSGWDEYLGQVQVSTPDASMNSMLNVHDPRPCSLVGNGDRAFQYYNQTNPAAKNDVIDVYECEPYVYAQNILGNEHPLFGLARNSWLSGTAWWCYQAGIKHILGIAPCYAGLEVNPCIPKAWDGFSVRRRLRGAEYSITVASPEHVSKGVLAIVVDGVELAGNVVPVFNDGGKHTVEVLLGRAEEREVEAAQ